MKIKRFLPLIMDFEVRLIDEESKRPDMMGYVLWFNGDNSVLIDEPNYFGEGRGYHHVYRLSDGRRRKKPLYPDYRLDTQSLRSLPDLLASSREIVNAPAVYWRAVTLVLAMTQYLPIGANAH